MSKGFYNLSPRIVNTLFLLLLQNYFTKHPEYPYDPDDSKTQMDIAADYDEEDYKQKALPVIIVSNGSTSVSPAGINTGQFWGADRVLLQDKIRFTKPGVWDDVLQFTISSSANIRIIATSKDDVDELAFEIAMFILSVRHTVGNIVQLQNIGDPQIQQAQQVGQNGWTGKYVATVYFPYVYTVSRRWQPVDEGPLLKQIETLVRFKFKNKTKSDIEEGDSTESISDEIIHQGASSTIGDTLAAINTDVVSCDVFTPGGEATGNGHTNDNTAQDWGDESKNSFDEDSCTVSGDLESRSEYMRFTVATDDTKVDITY